MGTGDLRRLVLTTRADDDLITSFGEANTFGVQANGDPFLLQNFFDSGRYVLVLVRDQPRALLDNGDLASEAAEHFSELEADIAATHDPQRAGQKIPDQLAA